MRSRASQAQRHRKPCAIPFGHAASIVKAMDAMAQCPYERRNASPLDRFPSGARDPDSGDLDRLAARPYGLAPCRCEPFVDKAASILALS